MGNKNLNKLSILLTILIVFTLFESYLVIAEVQTLGTFTQNTNITLKQTCSNCSFVNITSIIKPDGLTLLTNLSMDKSGTDYTYLLNSTYTKDVGRYIVNGFGDLNGANSVFSYDYFISQGITPLSTGQGIIYAVMLILAVFFFCLCFYFSIKIPFKNQRDDDGRIVSINKLKYLKLILIAFDYVFIFFIFGIAYQISNSYLGLNGISNLFYWGYSILLAIIYPALVITAIGILIFLFEDNILKKKIKRRNFR